MGVTEKFREYLPFYHFTILTDNNPLSHLQTAKLGALEQRWASQLAFFNFTIKYHPGRSNQNADTLSRQYLERLAFGTEVPALGALAEECSLPAIKGQCEEIVALPRRTPQDLSQLQEADQVIGPVRKYHREGPCPRTEERELLSRASRALLHQWSGGAGWGTLPPLSCPRGRARDIPSFATPVPARGSIAKCP